MKLDSEVTFRIEHSLLEALNEFCAENDITRGSLIRSLLKYFLIEDDHDSDPDTDPDEMAKCRAIVGALLRCSSSWKEIQSSLRDHGLEYYERGGGLALRHVSDLTHICKASEVGPGYSGLIRKFGEGFPGHRHRWLADRVLVGSTNRQSDNFEPED